MKKYDDKLYSNKGCHSNLMYCYDIKIKHVEKRWGRFLALLQTPSQSGVLPERLV